eukprot:11111103-Ditylum_brightwellii.AAC.1
MEMAEFLKNEEPADDDVAANFLKGLLWSSMSSKDVQSQGIRNLVLGLRTQNRSEFLSKMVIPTSAGKFMSNNSVGGPAHKVELLGGVTPHRGIWAMLVGEGPLGLRQ